MTPQNCLGANEGDCWRACIATVLDLPASEVPNFAILHPTWDDAIAAARVWLSARGLSIFRTYCSAGWELSKLLEVYGAENSGVPFILSGQCGGDALDNHAVVVMDGRIAHDPSGVGIAGPCVHGDGKAGWWWLDVICVGARA